MLRRTRRRDDSDSRSRILSRAVARTVIEELESRRLLTITMTGTSFSTPEEQSQSQTVATFTDNTPSAAENYAATINWGDGTTTDTNIPISENTPGTYSVSNTHTYPEDGIYTTTITVQENVANARPVDPNGALIGDSASASGTATVTELSLAITASAVAATEGTQFSGVVATAADPGSDHLPSAFTATIDWGDGTTTAGGITTLADEYLISGTHTYADEGTFNDNVTFFENSNPNFKVSSGNTVTVAEGDSATVTPGSITVFEHTSFSGVVGTFTDPTNPTQVASDWTASITWGDGTTTAGTVSGNTGGPFTLSGTHTYGDEGLFVVTATVADDAPGTFSFPLVNKATVAENDSFTPHARTIDPTEGSFFSDTIATFDDSDTVTTGADLVASIDWGDGTVSAGTIDGENGNFSVSGGHTYAEDGKYITTVVLSDDAPGTASATATGSAQVAEFNFTLFATPSITVPEGQPFSGKVATFVDPGSPDPASDFSSLIDWGDGTTTVGGISGAAGNFTISGSHTYADEGIFHIETTVSEPDVNFTLGPVVTTATVLEADTLSGTATSSIFVTTEGSTLAGALATFTDTGYPGNVPGDFVATIDFGDGTTSAGIVTGGNGTFTVSPGTHTFLEEGAYNATITLSDDAPGTATASVKTIIIVNDAPLAPIPVFGGGVEGQTYGGAVGQFTDADPNGEVGDYIANIDWGDGTATAGLIQSNGSGGFQVVGNHVYAEEGTFNILISVHDAATATAIHSEALIDDPAVLATGVSTIKGVEGQNISSGTVLATFTDPGGAESTGDYSASIDWGDGSVTAGVISYSSSSHKFSVKSVGHAYTEEGDYNIDVTISHDAAPDADAFSSAKISDAAIHGSAKTFTPVEGNKFSGAVATFRDDNTFADIGDFTAKIDWGDGTTTTGTFSMTSPGHFNVNGQHAYEEQGTYTVKVKITDDGGSSTSATSTAKVSDAPLTGVSKSFNASKNTTFNNVAGSFIDGDPLNTKPGDYSGTVDWGDGTTTKASFVFNTVTNRWDVKGSHKYIKVGTFTVKIAMKDGGGSKTSFSSTAHVT